MTSFRLLVLTPREVVCDEEVLSVVLLTEDGKMGFMARREECVVELLPGDLRFRTEKGEATLETDGGIASTDGKTLRILCGAAYRKEDAAEQREARASELMEEKKRRERSLAEYKMSRAALMRAFEKLKRSSGKR